MDTFFKARPTLEEMLDTIAKRTATFERVVFVCHAPPQGTGLGNIDIDADVGSAAVRAWIERYPPLLTLHGHIHESCQITGTDKVKIGRTIVHQPGQERLWGCLSYSNVDVEGKAVLVEQRRDSVG